MSSTGLRDELITNPEELYRLWRVAVCDLETTKTRRLTPATGLWKIQPQSVVTPGKQTSGCFTMICDLQKFISAAGICSTAVEERTEVKNGIMVCSATSVLHSFDNSKTASGTLGESLSTGS